MSSWISETSRALSSQDHQPSRQSTVIKAIIDFTDQVSILYPEKIIFRNNFFNNDRLLVYGGEALVAINDNTCALEEFAEKLKTQNSLP
jgi:hypothetical protein